MASVKNLKKDLNYIISDIIEDCVVWEIDNPDGDDTKSQAIIEEALATFDDLTAKINQKKIENKKAHFKNITQELEQKVVGLLEKVGKL